MLSKNPVAFPSPGPQVWTSPKNNVNQSRNSSRNSQPQKHHEPKKKRDNTNEKTTQEGNGRATQSFHNLSVWCQPERGRTIELTKKPTTRTGRNLASLGSFTGEVTNPIVQARLDVAISANALAKRLGLSRQYLSRAEQGTYSSLNPALLKWVANALGVHVRDVTRNYEKFQTETRKATVERTNIHTLRRNGSEARHLTFERWRSGYFTSPTQFAIAFCVHPDSVQKYEEGVQVKMPGQIKAALEEVKLLDPAWEDEATGARLSA